MHARLPHDAVELADVIGLAPARQPETAEVRAILLVEVLHLPEVAQKSAALAMYTV
jgi:hypothetical protein